MATKTRPKLTIKQKDFRKEVSRLNSMANKRIKRLQNHPELESSPALDKWKNDGGKYFSIRGKSQQDVRREFYRVRNYLDSSTSSITGTKKTLKSMAENTGLQYETISDLQDQSKAFFELANKVDEYLKVSSRGSQAIGYQRVWQAINIYTQDNDIRLKSGKIDGLVDVVSDLSASLLERDNVDTSQFFEIDWKKLN